MRTEELFDMLNALYTAFDDLVDRHGVHKVDTIGDGERRVREREREREKVDHVGIHEEDTISDGERRERGKDKCWIFSKLS